MLVSLSLTAALFACPQGPSTIPAAPHWAYRLPQRPVTAPSDRHAIDVLLEAKWSTMELNGAGLNGAGLVGTREADRATLVRRLFLDLVGLPPTVDELATFLADETPHAYQHLVDRLLASPHFGERWAVPWLDLARYGDTNGFNFDGGRSMWPYRDWVIGAINDDVPFDRFTILQLAGDLLPDADDEARIATGFHRNTMWNNEGGVDADEARWERLLDRASTTATTWLGSTFHCAQCHDHKYDPLPQRDFYGMVAFFETSDEVDHKCADGSTTMILREVASREPTTALHVRGAYDAPGELVPAHLPAAYAPLQASLQGEGQRPDRLLLARWLMAPDNPLTARVAANRIWTELVGRSLVDTPEDWGPQAAVPLQLDVLDWLATEYVRLGWSRKQLVRTIVTSAAYRREAAVADEQRGLDPDNQYFARASRFRLDAERVRDTWLGASGLLSRKIGGPSVYPLQADTSGVVPLNKVSMKWPTSEGEQRWRRGLYTYWRRTAPFVAFQAFDATSREVCTVRRERSNTPLQALVGLNDPTAVACADALAARMRSHAGDERQQLAFGFVCCTARQPDAAELDALLAALRAEPAAVAWSRIAIVMLNLDETLCRG